MTRAQELKALAEPPAITDLVATLAGLPASEQERFQRLIHVSESTGLLVAPDSMRGWIEGFFGSVEAVERQKIVKTTNLVTFEGTLFNALRSSRPMECHPPEDLQQIIASSENDPFCYPQDGTPEDLFGRVSGRHAITASNIAKYDGFHGVVIYDHHNPLALTCEDVVDYFDVGLRWAHEALE